jgi:transposase
MLLHIRNYLSKVRCAMTGHTRGKRTIGLNAPPNVGTFRCRRCGATWTRRDRKAKPA